MSLGASVRNQVPQEEVHLEEELVKCVMALLNKPQGLMTLDTSSDLIPVLAVRLKQMFDFMP